MELRKYALISLELTPRLNCQDQEPISLQRKKSRAALWAKSKSTRSLTHQAPVITTPTQQSLNQRKHRSGCPRLSEQTSGRIQPARLTFQDQDRSTQSTMLGKKAASTSIGTTDSQARRIMAPDLAPMSSLTTDCSSRGRSLLDLKSMAL